MVLDILIAVAIIASVFAFLVYPADTKNFSLPVKKYAHRGLHDKIIPENSLAAFRAAKEKGLGIELDVQYSKDRQIVVFHDGNLKRMCGINKDVIELTYEELSQLKLKNSDEGIPLFSEVLSLMDGLPVICEIKSQLGNKNTQICPEVKQAIEEYNGFMCMESFSPFITGWFKNNAPNILRGQLAMDDRKSKDSLSKLTKFLLRELFVNFISRPHFIAYRYTDSSLGLSFCRRFTGAFMVAWTVKGEEAMEEAKKKFDYFIFEKGEEEI